MIRIEIKTEHVNERSGISPRTLRPYTMREQIGWAYLIAEDGSNDPYPTKVKIPLDEAQFAFKPGFYTISPTSFYVGKYDVLELGRLKLIPAPLQSAKAA